MQNSIYKFIYTKLSFLLVYILITHTSYLTAQVTNPNGYNTFVRLNWVGEAMPGPQAGPVFCIL